MKYVVHIEVTQKAVVHIEAGTVEEAIGLVNDGTYDFTTIEYDEEEDNSVTVIEDATYDDNEEDEDELLMDEDDGEGYF